ncbi:MAG: Crossover junction endodeoxyribonuclease RuvC [uncultured bacterium]|uniref:Crossover junction endodeoxyribonuclease RuvC n=1 Tax=Candidatus Gottesmanbacteria bacterium RIFCSPLOWO2_01_FULL_43_11b TaxID=1798392 RepID=A0A1F6AI27_9BACT|nr:MAG: Crossover junction endodeoxyribonuclease RuvC [uncultured bacterium]OGG24384.1 MAG: crossover junction endodeoxyribonuclease RuvC [Candidatus Gottesmanbacteria bacterium RIFCSPLOWO2_01_FULL_43_11b]
MIIFGVDPGTARVGWAVLSAVGKKMTAKSYGCIETKKTDSPQDRLLIIYNKLLPLLKKHKPKYLSLEELFFATNAKTVMSVGQARGVVILAAAFHKIPVISYSPPSVKLTICGNGRADKKDVQRMVTKLLKLKEIPKPDDTADALAIALTHAYRLNGHTRG